jgi:integrase
VRGTIIEHVCKNGKKSWGYTFFAGRDENGKRLQKVKRGFAKKGEAEEALRTAIDELSEAPPVKQTVPTFAEFFERWDKECFSRECSRKTAERYRELGRYAIKLFGTVPLDQLNTMQLAGCVNQLSDQGGRITKTHPQGRPLAPKTVRHIAFLVQDCLEQAVDWNLIAKNPMLRVRKPKLVRRRPKVIDRHGLNALLSKVAGTRLFPFVMLSSSTGARRGELLALEWTDVDWKSCTLDVSKSLEQTKEGLRIKGTKSDQPRRFSIPSDVLDVLRDHQRHQEDDRRLYGADYANLNLIFARPDGQYYSPDRVGARVAEAMRAAGLQGVSLHSLRHSHASELLSQGAPITAVSERLGHASPNITLSIYSHALPADNQAAAKLWNDAMSEVIQESRKEAERKRMLSNVITGEGKRKVVPIKSAS